MGVVVGHPFDTIKVSAIVDLSAQAERSDSKLRLILSLSFEFVERHGEVRG